jgi:hypothetical protein
MNSKTKNIRDLYRGINDFKKGHQLRNNLINDENGDLLADSTFYTGGKIASIIECAVSVKLRR